MLKVIKYNNLIYFTNEHGSNIRIIAMGVSNTWMRTPDKPRTAQLNLKGLDQNKHPNQKMFLTVYWKVEELCIHLKYMENLSKMKFLWFFFWSKYDLLHWFSFSVVNWAVSHVCMLYLIIGAVKLKTEDTQVSQLANLGQHKNHQMVILKLWKQQMYWFNIQNHQVIRRWI